MQHEQQEAAKALANRHSITQPEAEALITACLGDVARADRAAAGANVLAAVRAELGMKRDAGTNIIEATAPEDRPREAVSQLRDLAEWLGAEGHDGLVMLADDLADDIARKYPESV